MQEPIDRERTPAVPDLPERMTIDEALAHAVSRHQSFHGDEARAIYQAILAEEPEHVEALHFFGLLMYQMGDAAAGLAMVTRAVVLRPDYVDAINNLGNMLSDQGQLEDAVGAFRTVINLGPHREALNNLGVVLKAMERYDEALDVLQRAVAMDPDKGDARFNLGNVLEKLGRRDEALHEFREAIRLQPDLVSAYDALAANLAFRGDNGEAIALLQGLLARLPENGMARHMLAAYGGGEAPARAADDYVEAHFDQFSTNFDRILSGLEYRAPHLVAAAIAERLPPPAGQLDVLDAGCGTGLCAARLKPYAARLTGVDLSGGMLRKARDRGDYDALVQVELTRFLQEQHEAFDIVASADTLVYFGDLAGFAVAVAGALRSGGILAFTLEDGGDDLHGGYRLEQHGRYCHAAAYVCTTLTQAGLDDVRIGRDILRKEGNVPVAGLVVTARKP